MGIVDGVNIGPTYGGKGSPRPDGGGGRIPGFGPTHLPPRPGIGQGDWGKKKPIPTNEDGGGRLIDTSKDKYGKPIAPKPAKMDASEDPGPRKRDNNFFGHYEVTKANVVKNAPMALNQTKKDSFIEPMANVRKVQGTKRAY